MEPTWRYAPHDLAQSLQMALALWSSQMAWHDRVRQQEAHDLNLLCGGLFGGKLLATQIEYWQMASD